MDQVMVAPQPTRLRAFLINTTERVESLPLMRPRWYIFDVVLLLLLCLH